MQKNARRVVGVAALVAAVVLAGCGVRSESSPHRIDHKDVPFGLLEREQGTTGNGAGAGRIALFLVGAGGLVEVSHTTPGPVDAPRALQSLLDGPTRVERTAGLTTALPSRASARVTGVESGTATVELAADFRNGTIPDQVTALGQIVYTLTALPGIERVRFEIDDRQVGVPRADGSLTEEPVGRTDYGSLLARFGD